MSRGFKTKICDVFMNNNQETQVILFSAYMPDKVSEVSSRFMSDHIWIMIKKEEQTMEGIRQFYISVKREEWKLATLCDLYETQTITQLVHVLQQVDWLTEKMHEMDFTVSDLPGDIDQTGRDVTMKEYEHSSIRSKYRISMI